MPTAVLIVTGKHPASVQVSEAHRISEPMRRGWTNSSIEHFVAKGARREFTLGENGRIEVHDLPEHVASLEDSDTFARGLLSASNQISLPLDVPLEAGVAAVRGVEALANAVENVKAEGDKPC